MRLLLKLLRRRHFAEGGIIIPRSSRSSDDVPLVLSQGRAWRIVDGKLVELNDLQSRRFNKLREP